MSTWVHGLKKQMMLQLCQQLPLISITRNNDRDNRFTNNGAEMGISFPWQTSVIYRTKHCCRPFSQNKFSICFNNKGPTNNCARPEVRKQMAVPNAFPSMRMANSVYKSSIFTYGGNLQGHQLLVWNAVFSLHTVHYRKSVQRGGTSSSAAR